MKQFLKSLLVISPLVFAVLLGGLLSFTDPASVGSVGVLVVFILMYLLCLSMLFVVLHFGVRLFMKKRLAGKSTGYVLGTMYDARKAYYVASVVAFIPVVLTAMRSFTEVHVWDIGLVVLLVVIAVFYVIKRD